MPPKSKSSSSAAAAGSGSGSGSGHGRRTGPKSTRQQFSACGACRMRRVKCDLKDIARGGGSSAPDPLRCTNCRERGVNCVDEYVEINKVKLLRRGRRLQQAEAKYGKTGEAAQYYMNVDDSLPGTPSVIPRLRPEFFDSPFFRRFHVQRPILDPTEFKARYCDAFHSPTPDFSPAAELIASVLVAWAASYGIDEFGVEEPENNTKRINERRARTNAMLHEILRLIDIHGVLRKPTWDGVRVLLLILPLTEDVQRPMERLSMYESTVNQVYTLCSLASVSSVNSGQGEAIDALVRARIFWYAHVHEGITTGLRGGRMLLQDDDLSSFSTTLPRQSLIRSNTVYSSTYRYATSPIRVAAACRKVHSALTGPKARQRDEVDEGLLREAWEMLEMCWLEFEELKKSGSETIKAEDKERFVHGWQIFIFECHNIIREALKQRITSARTMQVLDLDSRSSATTRTAILLAIAETHCLNLARVVFNMIKHHLGSSFFAYDASLVRDGCFFAGFLLANNEAAGGTKEDVDVCLAALGEMRWAFCKSYERRETLLQTLQERTTREMTRDGSVGGSVSPRSLGGSSPPGGSPPSFPLLPVGRMGLVDVSSSAPGATSRDSGAGPMSRHPSHPQPSPRPSPTGSSHSRVHSPVATRPVPTPHPHAHLHSPHPHLDMSSHYGSVTVPSPSYTTGSVATRVDPTGLSMPHGSHPLVYHNPHHFRPTGPSPADIAEAYYASTVGSPSSASGTVSAGGGGPGSGAYDERGMAAGGGFFNTGPSVDGYAEAVGRVAAAAVRAPPAVDEAFYAPPYTTQDFFTGSY